MTELSTPVATTSTPPLSLTSGQLPRFIEPIVLGVSLAVIAALQLVLGGFNVATWLIFSALVYLLAIGVFSAIVEGGASRPTASCAAWSRRPSCSPSHR